MRNAVRFMLIMALIVTLAGCDLNEILTPYPGLSPTPTATPTITPPPTPPPSTTPAPSPTPIITGDLIIHAAPGTELFIIYQDTIPKGFSWYYRTYVYMPVSGVYGYPTIPGRYVIARIGGTDEYPCVVTAGDTTLVIIPPPIA